MTPGPVREALRGPHEAAAPALLAAPAPAAAEGPRGRGGRRGVAPWILVLTDVAVVTGCVAGAAALTDLDPPGEAATSLQALILLALPLPAAVVLAFAANGLYVRWRRQLLASSFTEVRDIAFALALAGCVTLGLDHLLGRLEAHASVATVCIVVALLVALPAIVAARSAVRALLRLTRVERYRVLVAGSGTVAGHIRQYLSWDPRVTLVGSVDDDPVGGAEVLGGFADLPRLCRELRVDQLILAFSHTHPADAVDVLRAVDPRVAVSVVPRYFELLNWRATVREISGLPLVELAPATLSVGGRLTKRTFDLAVAAVLLVLLSPLMAAIGIAIRATSPGPVLFRQVRVGRGRTTFVTLKFRTMADGAAGRRAPQSGVATQHGALAKAEDDPRVTRVGRILRRTSLDELPQLFNVLRGDMSLVGPRPFVPEETAMIHGAGERRFEMRPGMTGLWQISGRSHLDYDDLLRLDYLYVAGWSLSWDLRILWYTPAKVLKGHGAY